MQESLCIFENRARVLFNFFVYGVNMANVELEKALVLMGGDEVVANHFGISRQAVSNWKRRGFTPVHVALELQEHTNLWSLHFVTAEIQRLVNKPID